MLAPSLVPSRLGTEVTWVFVDFPQNALKLDIYVGQKNKYYHFSPPSQITSPLISMAVDNSFTNSNGRESRALNPNPGFATDRSPVILAKPFNLSEL